MSVYSVSDMLRINDHGIICWTVFPIREKQNSTADWTSAIVSTLNYKFISGTTENIPALRTKRYHLCCYSNPVEFHKYFELALGKMRVAVSNTVTKKSTLHQNILLINYAFYNS